MVLGAMDRFDPLFEFVHTPTATPQQLVERLTVEGLPYTETPPRLRELVTTFRHLRQDARLQAAQKWCDQKGCDR